MNDHFINPNQGTAARSLTKQRKPQNKQHTVNPNQKIPTWIREVNLVIYYAYGKGYNVCLKERNDELPLLYENAI